MVPKHFVKVFPIEINIIEGNRSHVIRNSIY
jgi:hypothetical protein